MDDEGMPREVIPVGVTIAYKRKQDGFGLCTPGKPEETLRSSSTTRPVQPESSPPTSKSVTKSPAKQSTSLSVFVEGATLYTACLILPTVAGFLLRSYEEAWWWTSGPNTLTNNPMHHHSRETVVDPNSWSLYAYDTAAYYLCPHGASFSAEEPSILSTWVGTNWYWCPQSNVLNLDAFASPLSPDAHSTDFAYIAMMSLILAIVRVAVVHYFVPLEDSERVVAWVRCKSLHLLSADYSATLTPREEASPRPKLRLYANDSSATQTDTQATLQIPSLFSSSTDHRESQANLGLSYEDSDREAEDFVPPQSFFASNNDLGPTPDEFFEELSSRIQTTTSTPPSALERHTSSRLHAAPRYATAVFRLIYTTIVIALALIYFSDADFWPWYVGGHGSTRNCWDLSGGLANVLDSDFDQRNTVLRRYFLWQASYHWHSGAFHVLTILILLMHPKQQEAPRRFVSVQTSTTAYIRSLFQHMIALALIASAYFFSSLRRLVTIGMFAFDVSSWCLHLLQICINAPETSRLRRVQVVTILHRYLVIPVFVVCRFGIWPALWYSATFESQSWLRQLEQTLVPGAALVMRAFMHIWFVLTMGVTVVYVRRLLLHPHVRRIASHTTTAKWE